ncbi:MAG: hypothetical protein QOK10_2803 [Pseudonocardiales bacterium]|jgi:hypothetical protein|nr:hypothetical protein [Pseudonocardiales bacterium]
MTEHIPPYPSAPISGGVQTSGSPGDTNTGKVDVAKDQVSNVAKEASRQARGLLEQTRSEITDQAGRQQQRVAEGLRSIADELRSMTEHSGQSGVLTDMARQGADKTKDLASWLAEREPGGLVTEVKTFARQRPGTFLLLSAGVGLAFGRLTRGLKAASTDTGATASPAPLAPLEPPAAIVVEEVEVVQPYTSIHQEPYSSNSGGAL